MTSRRRPTRQRELSSFGRRTPRFSFEEIRSQVRMESELLLLCRETFRRRVVKLRPQEPLPS